MVQAPLNAHVVPPLSKDDPQPWETAQGNTGDVQDMEDVQQSTERRADPSVSETCPCVGEHEPTGTYSFPTT